MTPYAITPKEVFHDRSISANAKALCGLISTYESAENRRWITLKQGEFAEILGVTRETVNRLVKQLVNRGHLETKNATVSSRGRISLQYRVRHDLPEAADAVIQALKADEKKPEKTADVTPTSHEKPDVIPGAQRAASPVISASHRPPVVMNGSHHIGPDVTPGSLPYRDNSSKEELDKNLFYVEGATPKRRSKALTAEVERVTEAMWFTWPPLARKRHTRQQVADALTVVLSNIKLNARGDDLIEAGKRHVAERMNGEGDQRFVKGLVPFIAKGLWQNWAEADAPYSPPVDAAELERRRAIFAHDGYWKSDWGPKPSSGEAHP